MLQVNPLPMTVKGICRRFRKWLHRNGMFHKMPLQGPFSLKINGVIHNDPLTLPEPINPDAVEVLVGVVPGTIKPNPVIVQKPAVAIIPEVIEQDRELFKKVVREADPTKPGSKRRTDYRKAKNPKVGDGVQYYAKINSKWREVPTEYANPRYQLAA